MSVSFTESTEQHLFFFEHLGMLSIPFSIIWVFQILIGYSKFLRNAYLPILIFSIEYFS